MVTDAPIELLVQQIHSLDRQQCIDELLRFDQLPLDFSRTYLEELSLERLRHVLLAAVVTVHRQSHPKAG